MNKCIIYFMIAMLLTTIVAAGMIEDLQYYDRDRNVILNNDAIRTVDDYNVFVQADYLGTSTEEDVYTAISTVQTNLDNKPDQVGGGGMSLFELGDFLGVPDMYKTGKETFVDNYLKQNYPTFKDLALIQAQIDLLAAGKPLNKESVTAEFDVVMKRNSEFGNGAGYVCYTELGQSCFTCW